MEDCETMLRDATRVDSALWVIYGTSVSSISPVVNLKLLQNVMSKSSVGPWGLHKDEGDKPPKSCLML